MADDAPDGDTGPLGFVSATYHSYVTLPCLVFPRYGIGIIKLLLLSSALKPGNKTEVISPGSVT